MGPDAGGGWRVDTPLGIATFGSDPAHPDHTLMGSVLGVAVDTTSSLHEPWQRTNQTTSVYRHFDTRRVSHWEVHRNKATQHAASISQLW
jgi:hypothetical protein